MAPVEQVISAWKQLLSSRAAWARLSGLLADFPAHKPSMPLPKPLGMLHVENAFASAPGSPTAPVCAAPMPRSPEQSRI